jgi:hypothetical protein
MKFGFGPGVVRDPVPAPAAAGFVVDFTQKTLVLVQYESSILELQVAIFPTFVSEAR